MRYVEARFDEHNRDEAYRFYVTKSLQLIPQNKFIQKPYTDLLKPQRVDRRTGDEIVVDIIGRAGLKFEE